MKMNITRVQSIMSHQDGKAMLNLSMQAAKALSQLMQSCGIRSMRLSSFETMGGHSLRPTETEFFDGVPDGLSKWVYPAIESIGGVMSAFGISSMSLVPDGDDMKDLSSSWNYIVSSDSQFKQVMASNDLSVGPRSYVSQDRPDGVPGTGNQKTIEL